MTFWSNPNNLYYVSLNLCHSAQPSLGMTRINKDCLKRKLTADIIHCLKDVCSVGLDSEMARPAINSVAEPLVREALLIMRFKKMELRSKIAVSRLVSKEFGGVLSSKIAGDNIIEYRASLEDEGLSASTRKKRCGLIKHMFTTLKS